MRRMIVTLTILTLLLSGCSIVNSATTKTPDQAIASGPDTGSLFAINEVGLGPDGYVSLTNFTDQPASLGGLFLCQGTQCFELPDAEVAAGKTARVAVGDGNVLDGVVANKATIGELKPSDGEIALYSSKNVKDPKAMLVYLQWGSTPHADTQKAIDAGLWIKDSYAPSDKDATRLYRQDTGLWLFETK